MKLFQLSMILAAASAFAPSPSFCIALSSVHGGIRQLSKVDRSSVGYRSLEQVLRESIANSSDQDKSKWKVFVDLQCPYSRKMFGKINLLKERFGDEYKISTHITSLAFHRQSFPAHVAAFLIGKELGEDARNRFHDALYDNFEKYSDEAAETMTKADLDNVFADVAEKEGLFDTSFTRGYFLQNLRDRKEVIMPTWFEHKNALSYGVFKAPQHVINGRLLPDTDSEWGLPEFEAALAKLNESSAAVVA